MSTPIYLVDLKKQYKNIKSEIDIAIKKVLNSTQFILGDELKNFERDFSIFCQTDYAIGVGSGISALELGMRALGIGPGDEVITPANSFIASSSSISFTGAKPVFADCIEKTFNIDPVSIIEKISNKTKAIMPVHLYGQPANLDEIEEIAKKYKLFIIEDACQAHGARFNSKRVGSFGIFGSFSFYPGKNLGAYGDGGIIVTNDKNISETIKMMRNYGQKEKYNHIFLAYNSRLDNLQAAILSVKLKYLDGWNKKRQQNALIYNELLKDLPVTIPYKLDNVEHVYHLYVIRTEKRDELAEYLKTNGISTGLHYPIPIHLQRAYKDLNYKIGDFPVTEKLSKEILSLPMYPELEEKDIYYICKTIRRFFTHPY